MESVIPVRAVICAGTECPGFTKVLNSPRTSPPQTFTAPISVIAAPRCGVPPVVSRSITTKVVCTRGRPTSDIVHRLGDCSDKCEALLSPHERCRCALGAAR